MSRVRAKGTKITNIDESNEDKKLSEIQAAIIRRLVKQGKHYTGLELDGLLYPSHERVMVCTHKGSMLASFDEPNPIAEVSHTLRKIEGPGKNTLIGKDQIHLNWFKNFPDNIMYVDPASGRGPQEEVGWSELAVDYSKAGSVTSSLVEWLPQLGQPEADMASMSGLLDGLSIGEDYTMMFVKGVLTFRAICVGYSVKGAEFEGDDDMPTYFKGNKSAKVGKIGEHSCTIDLDKLDQQEAIVAMLCSMQYPAITVVHNDIPCIYSRISIPECDVLFVAEEPPTIEEAVLPPERWWKAMVGLAEKLGAIDDLVRAFRITRGMAGWLDGLDFLGVNNFRMVLDVTATKGCRSLLMDSNLGISDTVDAPTNLASSLGELVCDWAAGLEMRCMLMHLSDEMALANREINRNVSGGLDSSVGDSLMREADFCDYGRENRFYQEVCIRLKTEKCFLGNRDLRDLEKLVGQKMMKHAEDGSHADLLRYIKNMGFTTYFGPLWCENATCMVGEEGEIVGQSWGVMTTSHSDVYRLKMWLDVHGLSNTKTILCGYNSIQKRGVEEIGHGTMNKLSGASGKYTETYREVGWFTDYETRVGSETIQKDRLGFIKTYLGMEDGTDDKDETVEAEKRDMEEGNHSDPYNGKVRAHDSNRDMEEGEDVASFTFKIPVQVKKVIGKANDLDQQQANSRVKPILINGNGLGKEKPNNNKERSNGESSSGKVDEMGLPIFNMPPVNTNNGHGEEDIYDRNWRPPFNPTLGNLGKASQTFGAQGAPGFTRLVSNNGIDMRVKKVAEKDDPVARAIYGAYKELKPASGSYDQFRSWLQRSTKSQGNVDLHKCLHVIGKTGIGAVVYNNETQNVTGFATKNKTADDMIGLVLDDSGCDYLTRQEGDYVVTKVRHIFETSAKEWQHIWSKSTTPTDPLPPGVEFDPFPPDNTQWRINFI